MLSIWIWLDVMANIFARFRFFEQFFILPTDLDCLASFQPQFDEGEMVMFKK